MCLIYEMATRKVGFMKMSTRSRYGLRMLIELAYHPKDELVSLRKVANRLDISKKYLERIAKILEDSGLIIANKGVKGGYQLKKDPHDIRILDIISALEGKLALSECLITRCDRQDDCLANRFWLKLGRNIKSFLGQQSLADLMEEV